MNGDGSSNERPIDPTEIALTYHLEQHLGLLTEPDHRVVQKWHVKADLVNERDEPIEHVGDLEIAKVDLDTAWSTGWGIYDALDAVSGDLEQIAAEILDHETGDFRDELDDLGAIASGILILDRAWIGPEYRNRGLGPLLAGLAIETLGQGCRFAACIPAPTEGDPNDAERRRGKEALGRVWAKIGFFHFRREVWLLDLGKADFRKRLETLLRDAGLDS